ncbi:Hypothetical protein AA314_03204 [Archangium gephyra]|uniref:Uncharacterized protein n=1 Tax=Archangium gephyra TaxID=48 RepID=A0AAC8Q5R2_9BACT|nr:Hypothetical protein AA314_03204 [Archangium gephyra]
MDGPQGLSGGGRQASGQARCSGRPSPLIPRRAGTGLRVNPHLESGHRCPERGNRRQGGLHRTRTKEGRVLFRPGWRPLVSRE